MGHSTRCILDSLLRNFNCSKANNLIPAQSAHCLFNIRNSNKLSIQCASFTLHIDTWHTDSRIACTYCTNRTTKNCAENRQNAFFISCATAGLRCEFNQLWHEAYILRFLFTMAFGSAEMACAFPHCSNSGCVCVAVFYLLRTSASQCVISTSLPRTQTASIEHVCIPYFELICRSFRFV